ncbi:MAG: hypothetical protein KA821_11335 [Chitinophagaceae bacterium]|nr:hypothetical protein [Chitinophagaceae bacterium]
MRLKHPDYIKLVIAAYNKKRENNQLPLLLAQPTRANIRQECVNVYRERYDKKDEATLRGFFGTVEQGRKFLEHIQDYSADKFRPLDNFLKDPQKNLTGKYVELLAWLIDFPHRPFSYDKQVLLSDEEWHILGKPINSTADRQTDTPPVENDLKQPANELETIIDEPVNPFRREPANTLPANTRQQEIFQQTDLVNKEEKYRNKKIALALLILAISLGGLYILWEKKRDTPFALGNSASGCMYWADDHYEKIACTEEKKDRLLLPLNEERISVFKKITQEDTITEKSIGKVHYIKRNKTIEYYTTGGNHPIELTRSLRPLSYYMFDKYLRKREVAEKASLKEKIPKLTINP